MTKPLVQIGDNIREMTAEEYEQHKKDVAQETAQREALAAQTAARASALAKLAALGLTDDEIAALLP